MKYNILIFIHVLLLFELIFIGNPVLSYGDEPSESVLRQVYSEKWVLLGALKSCANDISKFNDIIDYMMDKVLLNRVFSSLTGERRVVRPIINDIARGRIYDLHYIAREEIKYLGRPTQLICRMTIYYHPETLKIDSAFCSGHCIFDMDITDFKIDGIEFLNSTLHTFNTENFEVDISLPPQQAPSNNPFKIFGGLIKTIFRDIKNIFK